MKDFKYADILSSNRELGRALSGRTVYDIMVISNIITFQFNDIFEFILRSGQINAKVTSGEFDNILQDAQKHSQSRTIIIFWELANLISGLQYKIDLMEENLVQELIEKTKSEIDLLFGFLSKTPLVIFNKFSTAAFNYSFIKENQFDRICNALNNYVNEVHPDNVFLINIEKIFAKLSIDKSVDLRYFYSSKALYTIEFYKEYSRMVAPLVLSIMGKAKKALILDCDNTIWKGIVGEDGLFGIELSSNSKNGIIFEEIQHLAVILARRGILIGLCSKNNEFDVNEVFDKRKDLTLKENHILIKKINWKEKSFNLKDIATELNIGLDSLVLLDDSPFEIDLINEQLPEVTTIQVPEKLYNYPSFFRENMLLFFNIKETKEDRDRVKLYLDEQHRSIERTNFNSIEDYLRSLKIEVFVRINSGTDLERTAQLTQKTNQFNLSSRRYSRIEIEEMVTNGNFRVYLGEVRDKFGEYGATALSIVKYYEKSAEIDTFLLSCRILGRNIEISFINFIISDLKNSGIRVLNSEYIKSSKNSQVEFFYEKMGFNILVDDGNLKKYTLDIEEYREEGIDYIVILN